MNPAKSLLPLLIYGTLVGCSVDLPNAPAPLKNQWADQGWSNAERHWYHHAAQGTNTFGLPYEWFKALEQPEFSFSAVGLMSDQQYLARMGFIPSPASVDDKTAAKSYGFDDSGKAGHASYYDGQSYNEENLPVGFAVGDEWYDPASGRNWPIPGTGRHARSLGLTCAACHTGQLEFGGNRILIDGGQGMISLDKFREALKLSLVYTKIIPGRFDRFAQRVLGTAYSETNAALLKGMFNSFLDSAKVQGDLEAKMIEQGVTEGFTRLDALNRIGNEVFASQMKLPQNMFPIAGPVSFPFIWNAPWMDWVQYNSSIQQPMVRNAGEAMGVKGLVNLSNPQKQVFDSKLPLETGVTRLPRAGTWGGLQRLGKRKRSGFLRSTGKKANVRKRNAFGPLRGGTHDGQDAVGKRGRQETNAGVLGGIVAGDGGVRAGRGGGARGPRRQNSCRL
jgi:hypothetical protein